MTMFPGAFKKKATNTKDSEGPSTSADTQDQDESIVQEGVHDDSVLVQDNAGNPDETVVHEDDENIDDSNTDDNASGLSLKRKVPDTLRKSAPITINSKESATPEKDFLDESILEDELESSDEEASTNKDKNETDRKRHSNDAETEDREPVVKKRLRFSDVVDTVSVSGEIAQENIPGASATQENFKRLKVLKEKIRKYEQEVRELEREIIIEEHLPTCAACECPLDPPFFCSEECQKNYT